MILVFCLLFVIAISVFSQKSTFSIGVGPSIGFALGNESYNYYYKNAVGGLVQANYGVTKLGSIIGSVSYQSIGAKNFPVKKSSLTQIKVGYKTGFLNSGFFVAADGGVAGYGGQLNKLVASTAIGYSFKLTSSATIELFPAYSFIARTPNNSMWLTANAVFLFKFPKKK